MIIFHVYHVYTNWLHVMRNILPCRWWPSRHKGRSISSPIFPSTDAAANIQETLSLKILTSSLKQSKKSFLPNLFTPEFLKWTLPFLNLDKSIDENGCVSLKWKKKQQQKKNKTKKKQTGKQCRYWWDGLLWAISSGSTLFAQVSTLVIMAERINPADLLFLSTYYNR